MYNKWMLIAIIVSFFIKFKFSSLDGSLEKYGKITSIPLITIIKNITREKVLDFLIKIF